MLGGSHMGIRNSLAQRTVSSGFPPFGCFSTVGWHLKSAVSEHLSQRFAATEIAFPVVFWGRKFVKLRTHLEAIWTTMGTFHYLPCINFPFSQITGQQSCIETATNPEWHNTGPSHNILIYRDNNYTPMFATNLPLWIRWSALYQDVGLILVENISCCKCSSRSCQNSSSNNLWKYALKREPRKWKSIQVWVLTDVYTRLMEGARPQACKLCFWPWFSSMDLTSSCKMAKIFGNEIQRLVFWTDKTDTW